MPMLPREEGHGDVGQVDVIKHLSLGKDVLERRDEDSITVIVAARC